MIDRFGSGRRQPRRRDRLQRRLPAAVLPASAGIPVLGIEPAANVAEVALEKGIPTLVEFFGRETARSLAGESARRPAARQQRARARPRPQRLRRRHEDPAQAGRRDHDGVPPPDAPDRGEPVGHDLPRALLLLLLPHRQPRVRGARPAPVRRRGAADARRLAAHLRLPRRGRRASAESGGRARAARARARAPATSASRPTSATARASSEDKRQILRFLIDLKERGPADRRLRRAGEGQHAAQLLRRAPGLHRRTRAI